MKKTLILLFNCFIVGLFIALFLTTGQVFAQTAQKTPEEIAKEHGVTFPIQELGNCQNFNDCRNFCEDPVNRETCTAFAKKKGFHEEPSTRPDEILRVAKTELGCGSENSCKTFCEQETNHDKCFAFAQKHNLGGGQVQDPSKGEILNKAKSILGCNSYESCKSFCEQEANREKCSEFAKQTGLRGGEHEAGPGGCTSEETCKAFCSDPNNYKICSGFSSSEGGKFSGPGGCDSEESCKAYCEKNPSACRNIGGASEASHEEYCNKTPNCSWTNNTCQCGSYGGEFGQEARDYADFCRQNPEKCGPGQSGGFENSQKREEFEKFCRENPEKCGGTNQPTGSAPPQGGYNPPPPGGYSTDPATGCAQAGGSWVNGSCQFSGSSNTTSSSPPPASTTQSSGGSTQPDPATECAKVAGCSWTGSTCACGGVQGAATQKGWIETILQMILRIK